MYLCNGMKEAHFRMNTELAIQQQEIAVLQKRLKQEQKLRAEGVHSLSEPLKEKVQNQQGILRGWTSTADLVRVPDPQWPTPAMGFQYTTRVSGA